MNRRHFVALGTAAGAASVSRALLAAEPATATAPQPKPAVARQPVLVRAGHTRHPDGTNGPLTNPQQTVVRSFDSEGRLAVFVVPTAKHPPFIGAPLHLHHEQDEFIHILAGEFVAEVGGQRYRLKAGDSLLMPMKVPHRWSLTDSSPCGAIHLYTPAGTMDLSWDPSPDDGKPETLEEQKADFEKYGMTLLGPPLTKEEITATV
jgi:quercetin dioxygenase-like cupin family protein